MYRLSDHIVLHPSCWQSSEAWDMVFSLVIFSQCNIP